MTSRHVGPTICIAVLLVLPGSSARAASVLDFEMAVIGAQFNGDTLGSTAGPFLIDGIPATFTTSGMTSGASVVTSSFGLGLSSGGADPDPASINIGEHWAFRADVGLSFLGVDFGAIQVEETFAISSLAWIGLAGISPASPAVTFIPSSGTFLFTDTPPADTDIFDLTAMTGGAPLPVPALASLLFQLTSSTFGPNDDVELSSITLGGVPAVFDFGDAPDPEYPTLLASDGARHRILAGYQLGATIDSEANGQTSGGADGDGADEDGVVFTSPLKLNVLPVAATLDVTASAPGKLDAWLDFNDDGDWGDSGEKIFNGQSLTAGTNSLTFDVSTDAVVTCLTVARFRFSSSGGLSPTGAAADGEVEDYAAAIVPDDDLDLFNRTISVDTVFTAANSLIAGGNFSMFPDLSILAPAKVTLHGAQQVILRNGLYVQDGAELTIKNGPVPTCP